MVNGWTDQDLILCREKLMQMKAKIPFDEIKYFNLVLNTLSDMINDLSGDLPPSISYNERLATIENELVKYKYFYDLILDFVTKIYKFDKQLNRIESIFKPFLGDKDNYGDLTGVTLSNERAFALTSMFYQQFDSILYPTFDKVFSERSSSVRFVDKLSGYNEADSFYIDFINRYFIQIVNTKDIKKLYAMIHEYGHVLSYVINPKAYLMSKDSMYDEVAAVFPEMLAYHINIGGFDPTQVDFEKYSSLITVYNSANALVLHEPYVDIWKEHKRSANKKFFKAIKKELDENISEVDDGLDTYIDSCGQYIIAYLVAIELLNLYKRDKNKALEIYRNILSIPYNESVKDYINSELNLASSLEEETSIMLDSFEKKLLKVRFN